MSAPLITVDEIFDRYDALLIDAYGVLIDQAQALPGAVDLLERLERESKPYVVVTNDASKLETNSARHYAERGLPIPPERIVTSGSLLSNYFAEHDLVGANTLVVGPPDSLEYVRRAGGVPFAPHDALPEIDVVVVGDEAGFDFLPGIERALGLVLQSIDRGTPPRLVLPNPDLIYPQGEGQFGFAAGSIALLIEAAVELRFGSPLPFERLGKPNAPIFAAAVQRVGIEEPLMIGDQLQTDVRGARAFGIDVALATWGLTSVIPDDLDPAFAPTWRLEQL